MDVFYCGQRLVGMHYSYSLWRQAHRRAKNVWVASLLDTEPNIKPRRVIIKTASHMLLRNETRYLHMLRGNPRIRQMIDTVESPPSIVLEIAEVDLRTLSIRRKLEIVEIKTIARQLLEALAFIHAKNVVHTDIKPQNILLSGFVSDFDRSKASVKLADFGNASPPSDHTISPKSFRCPESWLGLPWGPPADIWSFGAVIGSLMMGPYGELFGSSEKNKEDAEIEMLRKQNSMTGHYPSALLERAGGDWPALFQHFVKMDGRGRRVTWRWVMRELQISEEDGAFVERVLKIDPAERPTAADLLKDKWFAE